MVKQKYKPLHKSWKKEAMKSEYELGYALSYMNGANEFRHRALKALESFSVSTIQEPVIYNNKTYVSLEDVKYLVEGLYASNMDKIKK